MAKNKSSHNSSTRTTKGGPKKPSNSRPRPNAKKSIDFVRPDTTKKSTLKDLEIDSLEIDNEKVNFDDSADFDEAEEYTAIEEDDYSDEYDDHAEDEALKKIARKKESNMDNNSKSPNKYFRIFKTVLSIIFGISSFALLVMIAILDVLPMLYFIILALLWGGITVLIVFFLCRPKTKNRISIPLSILATVFSLLNIFGIVYLNKTFTFFDNLKGQSYLTEKYYVIVEKDSDYQKLEDLEHKSIATFNEGIEIYQKALEKLKSSVDADIKEVNSINALSTTLADHSSDAIFLSAVHKDVIEEDDAKFKDETRIIHTIEIQVEAEAEDDSPKVNITKEPFTILISGSDAYGSISDRSRSDVNMLATVNPKTHEILLTSIPRDYYVQLHGTTGARDKLTHAGIYGVQMSERTIEDLLNINIDYYVKVNFSTVVSLVDTIGGIDVYSDQQFVPWTNSKITIPKGNVHMDGPTALAFARERKAYATGDRHRVQNQQDVLNAIIKKVSGSTVILTKYSEILNDIASCMETNLGKDEIASIIKLQLQDMPNWQVGEYSLNGSDARNVTYSMGQQPLYVMEPDQATVDTAHKYITGILEGKTFNELGIKTK